MAYANDATRIAQLATIVAQGGFSFSQDGHALSEIAKILLSQGGDLERDERVSYLATTLKVLSREFSWGADSNDELMLGAFAGLAVDWPQLLG